MKCIETDCTAFYVDPLSKECVLGSLKDPCIASQLPNDGITVYRNKDLQKLDCLDCLIENGFNYRASQKWCTYDATDVAGCWSFCRANYHIGVTYPVVKYFSFRPGDNACVCKTGSNATKLETYGETYISGEVICAGKLQNLSTVISMQI